MKNICIIASAALIIMILGITAAGKGSRITQEAISDKRALAFANTVILDAGHGGEDGGAVAADGTPEKDLNLLIANGIAAYFELFGIPYIPVRTDDVSVGDKGLQTVRDRKRSDIRNRFALICDTSDAVFLSIHQNMFSESKYNGTQVFYSANTPSSKALAEHIQNTVRSFLQPDNTRKTKPSDDRVYLLYNAPTTAVMVECGFLSNEKELSLLKTQDYRSQIGYCIYKGLLSFLLTEGDTNGAES